MKTSLINEILLKESRYYSKEEIEQICTENQITINDFVEEILSKHSTYKQQYLDLLKKGKMWIGRTRCSDEFIKKNYSNIEQMALKAVKYLNSKYKIDYNLDEEDQVQSAIVYVMENRGDIEKNFEGYEEIMNRTLYTGLRKFIEYKVLVNLKIRSNTESIQKKYYNDNDKCKEKSMEECIKSKLKSAEEEAIDLIERKEKKADLKEAQIEEKCIEELKRQIERGESKEDALRKTSKKLQIGKQEMLNAMQAYLISKGKIKISKTDNSITWNNNYGDER